MVLSPGTRVGPYEILSPIGEGGMGQVWKARDTRLNRIVAIKTSGEVFNERFEREARTVAALNHPHICTVFDVGPDYIVMEYVEGSPIQGPLPLDQVLKIAIQLTGALEAAYRKGITHRDLKPDNILSTKSGIKVLDFGLAKTATTRPLAPLGDETKSKVLTKHGTIVGTLQYMAPEQLKGEDTDSRADIFSFGCILLELLTGNRAFEGENSATVIAAILEREPLSSAQVPPELDWILRRCFEKDPNDRWQTPRDLRAALERAAQGEAEAAQVRPGQKQWLGWSFAGALAMSTAVLALIHFGQPSPEAPVFRTNINPPEKNHFPLDENGTPPAISPDGKRVIFEAISAEGKKQLWLRPLDSLNAQPLPETESAVYPFWSPDSKSIGFFGGGKLKKIDAAGGPATVLADTPNARGGSWNRDGVIIFSPNPGSPMYRVSASGDTPRPLFPSKGKAPGQRYPWFLPDSKHFLYLLVTGSQYTIRVGSLDSQSDDRGLTETTDSFAIYSRLTGRSGYILFARGTTVFARPFDTKQLSFTGEAVPAAEHVQLSRTPVATGRFSVSDNGILVYAGALSDLSLTWLDREGKRVGTVGEPADISNALFSPDHTTLAIAARGVSGFNADIWLYDVVRGFRTRFTFDPSNHGNPAWSPDGRYIVFRSDRGTGRFDLYRKPADSSRPDELLYADALEKSPASFSPDGQFLAYQALGPTTGNDIWMLPHPLDPPGTSKPYPFLQTEFNEGGTQFSPDGRRIAYHSNESGRNEVYVAPFPGPGAKKQVSTAGGSTPRWRADGKELFYVSLDGRMMSAQMDVSAGGVEARKAEQLFGGAPVSYDVSTDGQRFLIPLRPPGESSEPMTVVQNWIAGLKK